MSHIVTVTWTASTDTVAGYNVYRSTNPPGNESTTPLNSALIVGTSYTDTAVSAGEKLGYVVTAVSASGVESIHSNESITTVPIQPPTNVVAVGS